MIYLTSDWHFCHNKDFIWNPRGFKSVKENTEQILANIYKLNLTPEDDLYVLGDLLLGGEDSLTKGLSLINSIPARLHLVRGNHDTNKRWAAYSTCSNVVEQENAIYLDYKNHHFYLSHYPTITSNRDYDKPLKSRLLNLCGHTHTKDRWFNKNEGYIYHVELDAHDNTPVNLDTILEEFYEFPN